MLVQERSRYILDDYKKVNPIKVAQQLNILKARTAPFSIFLQSERFSIYIYISHKCPGIEKDLPQPSVGHRQPDKSVSRTHTVLHMQIYCRLLGLVEVAELHLKMP